MDIQPRPCQCTSPPSPPSPESLPFPLSPPNDEKTTTNNKKKNDAGATTYNATGDDAATENTVLRIVKEIRNREEGLAETNIPWAVYALNAQGYEALQRELQQDESLWGFVQDKLRYDDFSSSGRFALRMPCLLHEQVIDLVRDEIKYLLRSVEGDEAKKFAKKIKSGGSATIKLYIGYSKHDPDRQFFHADGNFPGVVIEVSYSQRKKDLPSLAEDYILGSNGQIRVVVGIDLEYRTGQTATLLVWKRGTINEDGEIVLVANLITMEVFRNKNGTPTISSGGGLRLQLQDFATHHFVGSNDLTNPITISAEELLSFVKQAEDTISTYQKDPVPVKMPWVRSKSLKDSQSEELAEEDAQRFRAEEERSTEKTYLADTSFEMK